MGRWWTGSSGSTGIRSPPWPSSARRCAFLARHPGQVFSRGQLLDQVWGYGHIGDNRTVDVHISWLRDKLEKRPKKPKVLETVRGVGYRLRAPKPDKLDKPDEPDKVKKARKAEKAKKAEPSSDGA